MFLFVAWHNNATWRLFIVVAIILLESWDLVIIKLSASYELSSHLQNSSARNFNNCQVQAANWSFNFNFIKLNQSVYLINLLNIPSVIVELAVNLVTEQKSFMDTHRAQSPLNLFLQHRHTLKIFLVTRKGWWKWDCTNLCYRWVL